MFHQSSECCNHAALVQRFMSDSAYETVKFVAENMHHIEFIFNFLHAQDILLCVEKAADLAAIDISVSKYARVYQVPNSKTPYYVDYMYLSDVTTGIRPNNTNNATGSWVPVRTSAASNPLLGHSRYVFYVENETQQEFTLNDLKGELVDISFIFVQGTYQHRGEDFTYDPLTAKLKLTRRPARKNEQIVCFLQGLPAIPNAENSLDGYSAMTWTYNAENGGRALGDGSEVIIRIDENYNNIVNIFHNGKRLAHELDLECQILPNRGGIKMYKPLEKGDIFQVQIGGYFGNRVED